MSSYRFIDLLLSPRQHYLLLLHVRSIEGWQHHENIIRSTPSQVPSISYCLLVGIQIQCSLSVAGA